MGMRLDWEKLSGIVLVLAIHAAALYGLWSHRLLPTPMETATLFVNFIAPPAAPEPPPPKPEILKPQPPTPHTVELPQPRQLVAEAPVLAPTEPVAPAPPPKPVPAIEAPAPAAAAVAAPSTIASTAPVSIGGELSLSCPDRTQPAYPPMSRRRGESGTVILHVELDERGIVTSARVDTSSGFERLDEAALAAVKTWRCQPPRRNGQAIRGIARQPFKFILQGN
jgi:protein TonB